MKTIKLKIITPEKITFDGEVVSVSLPTQLGEITVLPGHIPLLSSLVAGEIRCRTENGLQYFALSGGFAQIKKGEINVLAETAEHGHEIDLQKAEEAKEEARTLLGSKDNQTHANASASFQKQLARIRVARKHHSHQGQQIKTDNFS